jgi:fumarate hydratase subunit beta
MTARLPVHLTTPLEPEILRGLRAGQSVLLSGTIYTARDSAHARMVQGLVRGEGMPFDPNGQVIYYVGPCPARPGVAIGSAGPTTSYRMDPFTPPLLAAGIAGLIGKGSRSAEVVASLVEHGAVYFVALGGAGALLSQCVRSAEVIAYADLGTEAIRRLVVERFPLVVGVDTLGQDVYRRAAEAMDAAGHADRPGENNQD